MHSALTQKPKRSFWSPLTAHTKRSRRRQGWSDKLSLKTRFRRASCPFREEGSSSGTFAVRKPKPDEIRHIEDKRGRCRSRCAFPTRRPHQEIGKKPNLRCNFGHAGDGNIHVNFIDRETPNRSRARQASPKPFASRSNLAAHLHEHGIGYVKAAYMD